MNEKARQNHSMKRCEQTWNGTAKIGKLTGRKLPLHHLHDDGGNTNTKTFNGEINIGGKSDGCRLFQSHIGFFHRFRRMSEDRTLYRTHIFLSVAHLDQHTHLRVAPGPGGSSLRCVALLCILKVINHNMFHRPLLDVLDPSPSFRSTPPPFTPTALPMTGIRRSPCATPHGGLQFGHLIESTPLTDAVDDGGCGSGQAGQSLDQDEALGAEIFLPQK